MQGGQQRGGGLPHRPTAGHQLQAEEKQIAPPLKIPLEVNLRLLGFKGVETNKEIFKINLKVLFVFFACKMRLNLQPLVLLIFRCYLLQKAIFAVTELALLNAMTSSVTSSH